MSTLFPWFFVFIACVGLFVKEQNLLYWLLALFAFFILIFDAINVDDESRLHVWFIAYSTEHGGINRTFVELASSDLQPSDIEQIEKHIAIENSSNWVSVVTYKYVGKA